MGAGDASDAAGGDGIIERFAQQGLADVRLGFGAGAKIVDPQACRRLLAREVGAHRLEPWRVRVHLHSRGLGEGFAAASRVRFVVHQAL
jgi:hypothetical protein